MVDQQLRGKYDDSQKVGAEESPPYGPLELHLSVLKVSSVSILTADKQRCGNIEQVSNIKVLSLRLVPRLIEQCEARHGDDFWSKINGRISSEKRVGFAVLS